MRLWPISNFADLSGHGGLLTAARWHSRGRPIVYLADHPASALLEVLVNLEIDPADLPDSLKLLAVTAPNDIKITTVDDKTLPTDWRSRTPLTRQIGDDWLAGGRSALLRVPSALVPTAFNFLLNPGHPDSVTIAIIDQVNVALDPRLMR